MWDRQFWERAQDIPWCSTADVYINNRESQAWTLRLFMASPSGLTSKTKSMDAFPYMCVSVYEWWILCRRKGVRVEKSGSEYREVRECVSRSQRASVEKTRCKTEQSESCEKENRVYRELREREQSVSRIATIKNSVYIVI